MLRGELGLDHVRVGGFFVDFVDSDDDFGVRVTSKANRFDRLRLDTVIGRYHDNHDVGQRRAVLPECRESLMARRIE